MSPAGGPKRRVVVVFGGRSAEHEVSVVSAKSVRHCASLVRTWRSQS